ncbi:GNAT family N-acetyltransferase [Bradyrhizobium sp. Tv2a-2]|uniref:GNAT family N-acetyltransferase n=1 Tax=Bradyrhizobium sp. Tv2a-2 TaxID=113395 RepID=UPI00040E37FF|nr:GNAT family N-acetyltransferase [Bradyrhizobium sp. Tv2a-2]
MTDPGSYTARERLRDGRTVDIRALHRDDRDDMLAAVGRTSGASLQRRFFGIKRGFSEAETAFFMDIDFEKHVALVALLDEGGRPTIVGGGRYVLVRDGEAELAFLVIDAYQGKGIGRLLIKHLIAIANTKGLHALTAEVLPENAAMLRLFRDFDFKAVPQRDFSAVHLVRELG